jgi:hypothetical protein
MSLSTGEATILRESRDGQRELLQVVAALQTWIALEETSAKTR